MCESGGIFVVFGYDRCPYTRKALADLEEANLPYEYLEISGRKEAVLQVLQEKIGSHQTVPIIFNNGIFIGGYDDLGRCLAQMKN